MAKVCVNLKVREQTKSRAWRNWERRQQGRVVWKLSEPKWSHFCQAVTGVPGLGWMVQLLGVLFKNERSAHRLLPNKNPLFQEMWWNRLERNTWSRIIVNHVSEVLQGPQLFSGAWFYRVQEKEEFGCWRGHHMLLRLIDRLRLYKPLLTV